MIINTKEDAMTDRKPTDDVLYLPFVFVPHGAPEPTEWRARHPGWVSFPATLRLPRHRRDARLRTWYRCGT